MYELLQHKFLSLLMPALVFDRDMGGQHCIVFLNSIANMYAIRLGHISKSLDNFSTCTGDTVNTAWRYTVLGT